MDGILMHNYYKNIETSVDDELNSFAKRMKEQTKNLDKKIRKEKEAQRQENQRKVNQMRQLERLLALKFNKVQDDNKPTY